MAADAPPHPSHAHAVLFDLDGTLLDTLEDIADAVNHALDAAGFPVHPLAAFRDMVGEGLENLVRRAVPAGTGDAAAAEVLSKVRARYAERLVVATRPYPGIGELLDALAERRVPAAVLSNKPEGATRALVDQLLAKWRFSAVLGQIPERPRKPDPAAALEAIRALGVEPARCLLVGDSWIDMATARNAGMRPVGVTWGFRSREELLGAGASALVEHPLGLLALLDGELP